VPRSATANVWTDEPSARPLRFVIDPNPMSSAARARVRHLPTTARECRLSEDSLPMSRCSTAESYHTDASVYASPTASRRCTQDSRPGWFATPFLSDSCIPNYMPVYPGADNLLAWLLTTGSPDFPWKVAALA
jgi:hypothetical protein